MPAFHRYHPYEIQTIAFFVSLIPFVALFVFMTVGRAVESRRRLAKPRLRTVERERASLPAVPVAAGAE